MCLNGIVGRRWNRKRCCTTSLALGTRVSNEIPPVAQVITSPEPTRRCRWRTRRLHTENVIRQQVGLQVGRHLLEVGEHLRKRLCDMTEWIRITVVGDVRSACRHMHQRWP